tara:strand:+ start:257 stop:787 length:531 start_codon:yes stop_codon:yes gene_type:complete
MATAAILTPMHSITMRMLEKAKREAGPKINFAAKLACNAAARELRKRTKKRYSGTLKESYDVRPSKGTGAAYEVYTSERRQSKISNRKKFRLYDLGRKGFKRGKKKLYVPLNQRGYDAYTKGYINNLKNLKFGKDFYWAKAVKPARGKKILIHGQRAGVRRFKERINLVVGRQLLR